MFEQDELKLLVEACEKAIREIGRQHALLIENRLEEGADRATLDAMTDRAEERLMRFMDLQEKVKSFVEVD